MALETVAAISWKANSAKMHRHCARRRSTVNDKRLAQVSPRVNAVNESFVMHVLRRHRPLGGLPLVCVGMIGVVAHDAELGIVSLLSVQLQLQVADVAVFGLDHLAPRHGFAVGDRKIFNDIETGVSLALLDNGAALALASHERMALNPDGA